MSFDIEANSNTSSIREKDPTIRKGQVLSLWGKKKRGAMLVNVFCKVCFTFGFKKVSWYCTNAIIIIIIFWFWIVCWYEQKTKDKKIK